MKKKKSNKGKKIFYVLGGITTTVCAFIAVPKIINKLSTKMYNPMNFIDDTEEDWGPEIVKRKKNESENLEVVSTEL